VTDPGTPDQPPAGSPRPPPPVRGGDGKFTPSIDTAEYDARAARLRVKGYTYQQIADELGYADKSGALYAVRRALEAAPREAGAEALQVELDRLDRLVRAGDAVLDRVHLAINKDGVVCWEGEPLIDDAPTIAALTALMRLSESRRKLLGLDAEQKVAVTGDVRYEIVGMAAEDISGGTSARAE
jgi:hypothetical protein